MNPSISPAKLLGLTIATMWLAGGLYLRGAHPIFVAWCAVLVLLWGCRLAVWAEEQ